MIYIKGKRGIGRSGALGTGVLILLGGVLLLSAVYFVLKQPSVSSRLQNSILGRTAAVVSKTFQDIFSPVAEKQVLEIDLGEESRGMNLENSKNSDRTNANSEPLRSELKKEIPQNFSGDNKQTAAELKNDSAAVSSFSNPSQDNFSSASGSNATTENKKSSSAARCEFISNQTPNHKIIFSEIAWMGSASSSNDEWMELKNNSGYDIRLNGWQILSGDENIKIFFGEKDNFAAEKFYLLERSDDNSAPNVPADKIYSGALSNSGAYLKIFDANCGLVDEIDASKKWPAGDSETKKTMERSILDLSWHTSANPGGTPKAENSTAFEKAQLTLESTNPTNNSSSPQSQTSPNTTATSGNSNNNQNPSSVAHLVIIKIQITGGPGKTTNDFVTIFNPLSNLFNLKGHRLVKRTKTGTSDTSLKSWTADTFIAAGGSYTWANSSFTTLTPPADAATTGSIADDNGIAIRQGPEDTGAIIDAVAWGAAQNGLGEGSAYPVNPGANQVLSRRFINGAVQDTGNNAADFEIR